MAVFDNSINIELRDAYLETERQHEIKFLVIGTDVNHVHFLVQPVPMFNVKRIPQTVKSLTARETLPRCLNIRQRHGMESSGVMHIVRALLGSIEMKLWQ